MTLASRAATVVAFVHAQKGPFLVTRSTAPGRRRSPGAVRRLPDGMPRLGATWAAKSLAGVAVLSSVAVALALPHDRGRGGGHEHPDTGEDHDGSEGQQQDFGVQEPVDRRSEVRRRSSGGADNQGQAPVHTVSQPRQHRDGGGSADYDQRRRDRRGKRQPHAVDQGGHGEDGTAASDQAQQCADDQPRRGSGNDHSRVLSFCSAWWAVGSLTERFHGILESICPMAQLFVAAENVSPAPIPPATRPSFGETNFAATMLASTKEPAVIRTWRSRAQGPLPRTTFPPTAA